jgi:ppGpp synthetase/RelA/SpoT-type nucleotidyltranferase
MSIVEEFLEHYSREIDYFSALSKLGHQRIDAALTIHGIRAMVTSRAKSPIRLKEKLSKRNKAKKYKTFKSIYLDIIDLAGVRVALYFPGDQDKVESILKEVFDFARAPKKFPERGKTRGKKTFAGYVATHYLVTLKPDVSSRDVERYQDSRIEIQVASVLMHAWAEVEHDLEYKPESGGVSAEESSILDEINGLVLTGEVALERLQHAMQRRVGKNDEEFRNQYELASFLSQRAQKEKMDTTDVGRVDALLAILRNLKMATPSKVDTLAERFAPEEKKRLIADVLIDRLLARKKDGARLTKIISSVLSPRSPGAAADKRMQAVGLFLLTWQEVERATAQIANFEGVRRPLPFTLMLKAAKLPHSFNFRIHLVSGLRNRVVHGTSTVDTDTLESAVKTMQENLIPELKDILKRREARPKRLAAPQP